MSNQKIKVKLGPPSQSGGNVNSVFGRTGTVVAQIGDYNTDQVSEGTTNKYFPEAPVDGKEYARKDKSWVEVQGGVTSVNGETGDVVLDGTEIELIEGGGVSVTGAISDIDTDLQNKVSSVNAGSNVEVNNADPNNPIVSAFPTTTAGLLSRTYFTGDTETLGAGTFYKSNRDGKGSVATVTQSVNVNDNQKDFFAQDLISEPYPIDTTIYAGSYSGVLNGIVDSSGGEQIFTVEIYKTDINCNPVNSGITGAPVGDLGVTVVAIATSGLIDLRQGDESQFSITAELAENLSLLTTNRIRYHVSAEKVGTTGGAKDISISYGFDHVCHLDVPVQPLTNTVINSDTTEFPSSATQFDINRNIKTNVDQNTLDIGILDNDKVGFVDNATYNKTGVVKMSRNSTTSRTYISFDGSDTPNVT